MVRNALLHFAIRTFVIITAVEVLVASILLALTNYILGNELVIINAAAIVLFAVPLISVYVIKPFLDDRLKALAEIRNISTKDPLTQLANRHLVVEHLDRVVAGCTRHHEYCAVMLINLDNFKLINERHGYEAGDAILIEVARRLRAASRSSDVIGRMGNDEFVVLFERLETDVGITGDRVLQIANKFISMINMPIKVKAIAMHVSASIGIRLLGTGPINTDIAIHEADIAMCRAKEKGGSSAVIFDGKTSPLNNRELSQYENQRLSVCS